MKKFEEGNYALCWYPKKYPVTSMELYWCKILSFKENSEYCTCELYFGEKFNPSKLNGIYDNICVSDLLSVESSGFTQEECQEIARKIIQQNFSKKEIQIEYSDSFYGLDYPQNTSLANKKIFATCNSISDAKLILSALSVFYRQQGVETAIEDDGNYLCVDGNEGKLYGFQFEILTK